MILAWITTDTSDFLPIVNQHKHWGEPLDFNEREVRRNRMVNAHAAQRRALAFRRFWINRSDFAVKRLTPAATGLFEHCKFRRM